jgi:hypothetical protein
MRSTFIVASIAAVSAAVETEQFRRQAFQQPNQWEECKADIQELLAQVAALSTQSTTPQGVDNTALEATIDTLSVNLTARQSELIDNASLIAANSSKNASQNSKLAELDADLVALSDIVNSFDADLTGFVEILDALDTLDFSTKATAAFAAQAIQLTALEAAETAVEAFKTGIPPLLTKGAAQMTNISDLQSTIANLSGYVSTVLELAVLTGALTET